MAQNIDRFRIDLYRFGPGRARLFLQEVVHEQRHVLESLAQWRNLDRNHREPIIKVLAKSSVFEFRHQRFVLDGHAGPIRSRTCGGRAGKKTRQDRTVAGCLSRVLRRSFELRVLRSGRADCPPHSTTSSASASSVEGISRPSAFAVFRLRTNRNRVGCSNGSSAGLAPLRMRSTSAAMRAKLSLWSGP